MIKISRFLFIPCVLALIFKKNRFTASLAFGNSSSNFTFLIRYCTSGELSSSLENLALCMSPNTTKKIQKRKKD
jgi:hypothetical protein